MYQEILNIQLYLSFPFISIKSTGGPITLSVYRIQRVPKINNEIRRTVIFISLLISLNQINRYYIKVSILYNVIS